MSNYEEIRQALNHIDAHERETWLRMGAAVKDEFGEEGFQLWDEWSQRADNYNARDAKSAWKSLRPGFVRIGSLFHIARENGYVPDKPYQAPSAEEMARRQVERAARTAAEEQAKADRQADVKELAQRIWNGSRPANTDHPYLQAKGIAREESIRGLREGEYKGDRNLVVPVYYGREIVNLQSINQDGDKRFLAGGRMEGGYAVVGDAAKTDKGVVIAEGFATAASIHQATGQPVIVAFNAGNMIKVSERLAKNLSADIPVILAVDNDASRTGMKKAQQAAALLGGRARTVQPEFTMAQIQQYQKGRDADAKGRIPLPSDFNDLQQLAGIDAVRDQLSAGTERMPSVPTSQPQQEPTMEQNISPAVYKQDVAFLHEQEQKTAPPYSADNPYAPYAAYDADAHRNAGDWEARRPLTEQMLADFNAKAERQGFITYIEARHASLGRFQAEKEQDGFAVTIDGEFKNHGGASVYEAARDFTVTLKQNGEPQDYIYTNSIDYALEQSAGYLRRHSRQEAVSEPDKQENSMAKQTEQNSIEYAGERQQTSRPKRDGGKEPRTGQNLPKQAETEPAAKPGPAVGSQPGIPETAEKRPMRDKKAVSDLNYEPPESIKSRYLVAEGKYLSAENGTTVMFTDKGKKISTAKTDRQTVEDMLEVAKAKGWDSIKISGSKEFKSMMYVAAESQGIRTVGYRPTPEDLALLERLRQERSLNSIETPLTRETPEQQKEPVESRLKRGKGLSETAEKEIAKQEPQPAGPDAAAIAEADKLKVQNRLPAADTVNASPRADTDIDVPLKSIGQNEVPAPLAIETDRMKADALNPELNAAKSAYMDKAGKLSKPNQTRLQYHEAVCMDVIRNLEGQTRTDAMRNYYEHTVKMMNGSRLNLPKPAQIPSPSQDTGKQQKPYQAPQHEPSRSEEPEIGR